MKRRSFIQGLLALPLALPASQLYADIQLKDARLLRPHERKSAIPKTLADLNDWIESNTVNGGDFKGAGFFEVTTFGEGYRGSSKHHTFVTYKIGSFAKKEKAERMLVDVFWRLLNQVSTKDGHINPIYWRQRPLLEKRIGSFTLEMRLWSNKINPEDCGFSRT
jgi:hypothetical protein